MSRKPRQPQLPGAEAWWDDLLQDERSSRAAQPAADSLAATRAEPSAAVLTEVATAPAQRGRLKLPSLPRPGFLRRQAPAELTKAQHREVRERRRRRSALTIMAVVLTIGTACAVGVIMLNNLVVKRSAELGRLETERRTLRTENAMLAAEIAKLSAPPRISQIARKKLGMDHPPKIAQFIYLDEAHKPVSEEWKTRKAAQVQNQLEEQQASATAAITGDQGQGTTP